MTACIPRGWRSCSLSALWNPKSKHFIYLTQICSKVWLQTVNVCPVYDWELHWSGGSRTSARRSGGPTPDQTLISDIEGLAHNLLSLPSPLKLEVNPPPIGSSSCPVQSSADFTNCAIIHRFTNSCLFYQNKYLHYILSSKYYLQFFFANFLCWTIELCMWKFNICWKVIKLKSYSPAGSGRVFSISTTDRIGMDRHWTWRNV